MSIRTQERAYRPFVWPGTSPSIDSRQKDLGDEPSTNSSKLSTERNDVAWTQGQLLGPDADRTSYLYELVKRNPELAQGLNAYLTSGKEAGDQKLRELQDQMVEEHFDKRTNQALIWGGMASIAALATLATAGLAVATAAVAAPNVLGGAALTAATSFIPMAAAYHQVFGQPLVAPSREFDPSFKLKQRLEPLEVALEECLENKVLVDKLRSTQGWRPETKESEQTEAAEVGAFGKLKGFLNVTRNLPKIVSLPILNALAKPRTTEEEARVESLAKTFVPLALVTSAVIGATVATGLSAAAGLGGLVFYSAFVGPSIAGTSDGLLNIGRKTREKVAGRSEGGFLAEVVTGYREAFSTAYERGVNSKPSIPLTGLPRTIKDQ